MIRIARFLRYALLAGAVLYILAYLSIAFFRIRFPFELEWAEGGSLEYIHRILAGQKIYVPPSLDFVPFFYTPLYFYLGAIISKIVGISLIPLRCISLASSLGSMGVIFLFVKRQTKSNFLGLLASSLFAATFPISGKWFGVARVDPLFLFLLLSSLYLIKSKETVKSYILAGVLISLSFLTKQTALTFIMTIMLYCILTNRRLFIAFAGTVILLVGGSTLLLNHFHNGWYNFYVFWLVSCYPLEGTILSCLKQKFLLGKLPIALIMAIGYIFSQYDSSSKKDCLFYFLITICTALTAFLGLSELGGHSNLLLPVHAVTAILFGLAVHKASEYLSLLPLTKQKGAEISLYLIVMIQFISLIYNPIRMIPGKKFLETNKNYVNAIRQIKGDVFAPSHSYLLSIAGKKNYANWDAMWGLLLVREDIPEKVKLVNEMMRFIRERRFSAIIVDFGAEEYIIEEVEKYYTKYKSIPTLENMVWLGESQIYVPKEPKIEEGAENGPPT